MAVLQNEHVLSSGASAIAWPHSLSVTLGHAQRVSPLSQAFKKWVCLLRGFLWTKSRQYGYDSPTVDRHGTWKAHRGESLQLTEYPRGLLMDENHTLIELNCGHDTQDWSPVTVPRNPVATATTILTPSCADKARKESEKGSPGHR